MAENIFTLSPLQALAKDQKAAQVPPLELPPYESTAQISTAPSSTLPVDLRQLFEQASEQYQVPVNVLAALAQQESSFNPRAVGVPTKWGRAKGLMQYIDPTAKSLGINPFDPAQAVDAAAKQMRERLDNGYSMEEAVMAHHGGDDRAQWGPKTSRYVGEVMGKAGQLTSLFGKPQEAPFDPAALQAELDSQEPGRYRVLTAEQAEDYQRRQGLIYQKDPLGAAVAGTRTPAPSPLVGATPQQAPSPLTPENQMRVNAGLTPKETRPYDTFTAATSKTLSNVPERFQQSIAGLIQMQGEDLRQYRDMDIDRRAVAVYGISPEDMRLLAWAGNEGLVDPKMGVQDALKYVKGNLALTLDDQKLKALSAHGLVNPEEITAFAKDWREQTKKTMAEVRPEPGSMAYYGSAAIGSIAEMAPMLAAAIATRNPKLATGIMAGQVGGQSYAEGREKGLDEKQAQNYALLTAAAEAAPEALVIGQLLKPGAGILKKVLQGTVLEGSQEAVTAALQAGIDQQMVDPNMTLKEALVRIRDGAIVGALSGGAIGGVIGGAEALTNRGTTPQAPQATTTPAAEPQGQTPVAETPAAVAPQPVPVETPVAEAPTGPLGRSLAKAQPVATAEERVTVSSPSGAIAGTLEEYTEDGQGGFVARVLADDGQVYQFTEADGVQIAAETPATPAETTVEQEAVTAQPEEELFETTIPDTAAPVEAAQEVPAPEGVVDAGQQADSIAGPAIETEPAAAQAAEAPTAPVVINQDRYAEMDEGQLRERLKYLAGQAKATGGWNKMLVDERRKVERAINKLVSDASREVADAGIRNDRTPSPAPITAEAPPVETGSQATAAGPGPQRGRPGEPMAGMPATVSGTDQATDTQPALKWFGSQEKADAYIAKKNIADSHEVVPVNRNRFEIHPKSQAAAGELAVTTGSPQSAPAPTEQPKAGGHINRGGWLLDAKVGDTVVPSVDVGYSRAGDTYKVDQIDKRGTVHVTNTATGSSTTWSRADLERAAKQGVTYAKAETPALVNQQGAQQPETAATQTTEAASEKAETKAQDQDKPRAAPSKNVLVTDERAAELRQRLKGKLSQLNSGIDPEILAIGTELAVYHVERGARTFAAFAKNMADDLGTTVERIRPYLRSWFNGARDMIEDMGGSIEGMDSAESVRQELAKINAALQDAEKPEAPSDDTQTNTADAGADAPDNLADRVQEAEGARPAEPVSGQPAERVRREREPGPRGSDQPARIERQAGQGAGDEQPVRGGRKGGAEPGSREDRDAGNYRIQPGELKRTGSWKATAEQNVRIVELVKQLTAEGRQATPEEKALLTKFTGWGASEIANGIFPNQYGQHKDGWRELGERLKAALTPEEYAQAKRTTQYAHYTSEPIIRSVYSALDRMGFNGGQVLEPGMGVGLFNGLMPDSMVQHSTYTGIEYDSITGNIAKLLYPESNIVVGDFTQTKLPKDFFDAAIGNPPFGQIKIQSDPEYKKQGFLLHDYFFAKTIDRVKPGGLLVFVTSKGTMDKANDRARKYLAERADLVGAIRLPQTAFKDNAGTEVVTDVIFLKKRAPGQAAAGEPWAGLGEVQTPQGPAFVNEYFVGHPEMVLGKHAKTGSMYRADEYTVEPIDGDIEHLFAKAIENLPEGIYRPERGSQAETAAVQRRDYDPKVKKEGGVYVADDGALMQVESGQGVPLTSRLGSNGKEIELKPREVEWLKGYTGVRDALKQAQYDQLNEGAWEKSLKALNKSYSAFVKEHGHILAHSVTERENDDGSVTVTRRFKNDPLIRLDAEGALAYALEVINADGTISNGAVLNGRTLNKPVTPTITNERDAMFVSLNDTGRFDLAAIAKLAGKTEDEVVSALGDAIYEDPAAGWTTADDYLSGNVVRKLKEAEAAARLNKKYGRNVEALKNVQPRALAPQDITVQLGSAWVPASDVQNFAAEIMGDRLGVSYSPVTGQWNVMGESSRVSEWGTGDKSPADILESVLNNRQLKVTYRDSEGKTHTDAEATEKVNDIAKKLRAEFKRWIWTDGKRADRLSKFYNENYNNIAPRQFDGAHLTLPGVSSRFQLRPHQKRAIWRTVQQGDTYYAHAVGAGKTFTMIAAGMEERRLGLVKKPMYVVPNHMLAQFSKEFLELYPTASIMVADEQNFHTHNRRKFVAQAALNDPDAIVITHSAFGRIGMSPEFSQRFINDQIDEWKSALDEVDKQDRVTRKQIERRIEQLENRLKGIIDGDKKDRVLNFEELGVDRLYVDEGHEFRKLDFPTNRGNIKGIDSSGSQRSMDLFMKVQYLRQKSPNRTLVMASGTPVTNTMGELFTVQRYFQPVQLDEDGDAGFDAWANHYGEVVDGLEQNAAGGYETVSRFAKFVNVPELMSRVRSFMDILTGAQLGDLVQRPDVIGGGRQVVVTPVPDGYKAYQKGLEDRIKAIRNRKGPPKPGDDIILNVIADGRFSAIDMRFVDPTLPSDPNSKLNRTLDDMLDAYKTTADNEYSTGGKVDPIKGGSLMLFTDIGLGEQSAKNRGFDMKAWIEKRLIEGGVKPDHIAFMRDYKAHAKKERLFDDLRQGRKRILIGGKDMETGVNAQKRLVYLGHLDAPWFPASVEQREGRIIRQGNQNQKVSIRAYATKGSYDSTMWGMNARKARFIEQAMSGDTSVRSMEDVSEASAFEMAAALASGDERYLKLAGLKGDVERLSRLYSAHLDDQRRLRSQKMGHEASIKHNTEQVAALKEAIAQRKPIAAGEFSATADGKTYDKRDEFSEALFAKFKDLAEGYTAGEQTIGEIGGFPVVYNGVELRGGNFAADVTLDIPGSPDPLLVFPIDPNASVHGIATRAANQVNGLDRDLTRRQGMIAENQQEIEKIDRRLGTVFPEQAELAEKQEALAELEAELEAEGKEANADAASATVEVEQPKYSLAEDDRGQDAIRPAGTAAQDLQRTVGGRAPAQGWAEATRIRRSSGEPARVYRGAVRALSAADFQQEALGGNTGYAASGLGVFFTTSQPEAQRYGDVDSYFLDIRRPKAFDAHSLPNFDTVADAAELRRRLQALGYDGIVIDARKDGGSVHIIAFSPDQVLPEARQEDPEVAAFLNNPDAWRLSVAETLEDAAPLGIVSSKADRALSHTELRDQVFAGLMERRNQPLSHPVLGEIAVTREGVRKSRSSSADRGKLYALQRLGDLVANGVHMGSTQDGNRTFHHIGTRLNVDGVPVLAMTTVQENAGGLSYYNTTLMQDVPGRAFEGQISFVDNELGAYKRPLLAEAFDEDRLDTGARHAANIRGALETGPLAKAVRKAIETGKVVLHARQPQLNERAVIQGYTDSAGNIHLVTDNLTTQNAMAVLLHEAFHAEGREIAGYKRWRNLMDRLQGQFDRAKSRAAAGLTSDGNFFDQAYRRVEKARGKVPMSDALALEEFGAYAIENYETAPAGVKSWVDAILGVIKDFLARRLGVQLGEVTPEQLRAMAVSAIRASNRTATASEEGTLRASMRDEEKLLPDETALEDATKALEQPTQYKPDFIGQLAEDLGRVAKFLLHPRQIASLHKPFTPVYNTAVNQFEMRDRLIDELQQDHRLYDDLKPASKAKVNQVLELGRLLSATYAEAQLRGGVTNPGYKNVVKFTEGGSSYRTKEKLKALLTQPGEVIQLSEAEIEAYLGLRKMFDNALDKFKDQTLDDFGFPELVGVKNATKEIMAMIDEKTPPARAERLMNIARFIAEIEQAKRTGYVPFARFGDYVVAVKERQFPIEYAKNPAGGWIARGVPDTLDTFMEQMGATYDEAEGGWQVTGLQRQALQKESERTVYSAKVEFTLRDKAMQKLGKPVEELPSVKAALAEAEKWKEGNPDRRIVAFETIQKKPEGGMQLSDVDALAEVAMLDTETWDAVRDQLADAIKGRSFRKHFFQSDNVPGYSGDFERSIANYMAGMAGYLSRRHYNRAWDDAIADIKAKRLFDYANKYRAYVNEPQEELAMLRQVGFLAYIAGVPATAFVNLTQPFLMTAPALGQVASMPMVMAEMSKAYRDALKMVRINRKTGLDFFDPETAPADIRDELKQAWAEGAFVPLQTYEVMATARHRNVGQRQFQRYFDKTVAALSFLFSAAERLNRLVTFIAAARLAKKPGVEAKARQVFRRNPLAQQQLLSDWSAKNLAEFMIDETQFRMGKANRPTIMRNLGAIVLQFKGFVMQSLEAWYRWANLQGKDGAKAVALSLGAMVVMGGLWGMPGADDLRDVIEKAYKQVTKQDLDLKTELRQGLYELTGERWLSEVASKGATYPFGLDMSRVGMGNIAPDSPLQVFGIPADMFIGRPTRAFGKAAQEDYAGAVSEFLPNFLKNPITAYGWQEQGVRDGQGRLLLPEEEVTGSMAATKALGFQPSSITNIRDYEYAQRRMETANDLLKRDYASKLAKLVARMEKNPEKVDALSEEFNKLLAEIEEINANASGPEEAIIITRRTLKERVAREMGGVDSTWGKERKQARGASDKMREAFGLSQE